MELNERIVAARRRRGWDPKVAAERLGVNPKTYYLHESGVRNPKRDALKEYAKTFRVPLEWLAFGRGSIDGDTNGTIPVLGEVGLETDIDWRGEASQVLDVEDFPLLAGNPNIVALIGRGKSMQPVVHDGDIVLADRTEGRLPHEFLNQKAIVKVVDGPYLLKTIRSGRSPDRWNLESFNQVYETLEDQKIEAVYRFLGSFQRGAFRGR